MEIVEQEEVIQIKVPKNQLTNLEHIKLFKLRGTGIDLSLMDETHISFTVYKRGDYQSKVAFVQQIIREHTPRISIT